MLREPAASIRQFPLLNEGHLVSGRIWVNFPRRFSTLIDLGRRWLTTPRYLVHDSPNGQVCFACVVTIGVPGLRFGCILDGPVMMGGGPMEPSVFRELLTWAHQNRYVALRLTHSNEAFLQTLATLGNSDRTDGASFYPYPTPSELYVNLSPKEATLLAGFQAVARRNIRQAQEAGYVITVDHKPDSLERAWPAFQARSAQKGINYRNLEIWKRIMHEAEPHRAAHLHTAWRKETPVAAILVLRDCTTAHYFLGAIDLDALADSPSPACLLHWSAMRLAAQMGCSTYNLGTRSGPVYTFKAKFRPTEHQLPRPLTFAINPKAYRVWRHFLPAVTRAVA